MELAQKWGVLGYEKQEVKRPQFQGQFKLNPATGELEKHYPWQLRLLKYLVRKLRCVPWHQWHQSGPVLH